MEEAGFKPFIQFCLPRDQAEVSPGWAGVCWNRQQTWMVLRFSTGLLILAWAERRGSAREMGNEKSESREDLGTLGTPRNCEKT